MTLREEWFGGANSLGGNLREIGGIGSGFSMAKSVWPHSYDSELGADRNLRNLVELEYQRYLKLTAELDSKILVYLSEILKANSGRFPETESALYNFVEGAKSTPLSAAGNLTEMLRYWADSQAQSRKTRAGKSLEHQLEYVLKNEGITDFETQRELEYPGGNTKVDFIFPSAEHYSVNPSECVAISCQTSSNDRFRLALEQVPHSHKYICTTIGSDNLGANLQRLSQKKVDSVESRGGFYVMFPEGKENSPHMRDHPAIITYSELFEALSKIKSSWD